MGSRMLLIFAALHWIPGSLATCYLPNGQEQPGVVCNTTAEFSACCADVDMCTNQGFCKSPVDAGDNYYWREGCTDPTWTSSACPRHCYDQSTGMNSLYIEGEAATNPTSKAIPHPLETGLCSLALRRLSAAQTPPVLQTRTAAMRTSGSLTQVPLHMLEATLLSPH